MKNLTHKRFQKYGLKKSRNTLLILRQLVVCYQIC